MLSSRSNNVSSAFATENLVPSSSTRQIAFKTPARSSKRGRATHDENAVYGYPRTAGFTGRKKTNNVVFGTPAGRLSHTRLKTDKISRTASKATALSEITNKTPFKTHLPVTPGPTSVKPSKSFTILNDPSTGLSSRRVSSTRKKLRLPRSASKNFETPDTRGNHWDVSDVSIEASMEEAIIAEQDYDEVEYGPPTAIDPKYEPHFDMPNYKDVGAVLLSLFRQTTFPDNYDPVAGFDGATLLAEAGPLEWEKLELPEIPFDDFLPLPVQSGGPPPLKTSTRPQSSIARPSTAPSRSTTAGPRPLTSGSRLKFTAHGPAASSIGISALANAVANPINRRAAAISHSRIPSLSKPTVVQVRPSATSIQKPSSTCSKIPRVSHSRTASTTSTAHSQATTVAKPGPTGRWKVGSPLLHSRLPDDIIQSLFTGTEEGLDDDYFFEV